MIWLLTTLIVVLGMLALVIGIWTATEDDDDE
jgi:hypothetical protein